MKRYKETLKKHNFIYDVVEFWLSDKKYEYYMLSLIDNMDTIFEFENKSIAEVVLEKFCNSCKEELINQKSNVVDKEYYLKIFNRIYNHSKYEKKDIEKINELIENLNQFVINGKYKLERKAKLFSSIDRLTKKPEKVADLSLVDKADINEQLSYFNSYITDAINDNTRINLTDENTFLIGDNNGNFNQYAYSFSYADDCSILLKIHVIDINSLMYEDTPLYLDMKNNNRLDDRAIKLISLKQNKISPTITYQLCIDFKGIIRDCRIYKSKINPNIIVDSTLSYEKIKQNENLKPYLYAYKILEKYYEKDAKCTTINDIDNTLVDILNNSINRKIRDYEVPFIYKIHENQSPTNILDQITNLNWYMFRLTDKDFNTIYNIICNSNNKKARYSLNNIGHYAENKKSMLNVTKPISFIGLKLQELITNILNNNYSKKELVDKYNEEFLELVNYYNKKFYDIDESETIEKPKQRVRN